MAGSASQKPLLIWNCSIPFCCTTRCCWMTVQTGNCASGEILSDATAAILYSAKGFLSSTANQDCELQALHYMYITASCPAITVRCILTQPLLLSRVNHTKHQPPSHLSDKLKEGQSLSHADLCQMCKRAPHNLPADSPLNLALQGNSFTGGFVPSWLFLQAIQVSLQPYADGLTPLIESIRVSHLR